uniref:DRBM domain-containing protein n=1 Tax=Periophthalmus magnuspinnatus TaxID=409849 RepID=A0A3B3ZIP0_9GOBI
METPQNSATALVNKLDVNYKNAISEVFEFGQKLGLPVEFTELKREGPIHKATFSFKVTVGGFSGVGEAQSVAGAKKLATQQVLPELQRLPLPEKVPKPKKGKKKDETLCKDAPVFKEDENPISCLNHLVFLKRVRPPVYTVVDVDRTTEKWIYHVQVTFGDNTVTARGFTLKDAKKNAAALILNGLGYSFKVDEPPATNVSSESKDAPSVTQEDSSDAHTAQDQSSPVDSLALPAESRLSRQAYLRAEPGVMLKRQRPLRSPAPLTPPASTFEPSSRINSLSPPGLCRNANTGQKKRTGVLMARPLLLLFLSAGDDLSICQTGRSPAGHRSNC